MVPGDKLLIGSSNIAYVYDNDYSDNFVYLIKEDGSLITSASYDAKIIRSGRKNQQQVSVGSITSRVNPMNETTMELDLGPETDVLASNAVEYSDDWGAVCSALNAGIGNRSYTLTKTALQILYKIDLNGQDCSYRYYDAEDNLIENSDFNTSSTVFDQELIPLEDNPNDYTLYFEDGSYLEVDGGDCSLWKTSLRACDDFEDQVVNPYLTGIRGNYRNIKSWTFLAGRNYSDTEDKQRYNGVFNDDYVAFWEYSGGKWKKTGAPNINKWTWASEITKFTPYSLDIESRDALNRYSAQLLGYNNTYVTAVATNARYNDLAFDGFEDYDLNYYEECCQGHFNFYQHKNSVVEDESHTGRRSLRMPSGNTYKVTRTLKDLNVLSTGDQVPYATEAADIIGEFGPEENAQQKKRYVLSLWAKEHVGNNERNFDVESLGLDVKLNGNSIVLAGSLRKSKVIDGWQRFELTFEVPSGSAGEISVELVNNGAAFLQYIDDVRIHPFNSYMKSYVYDPISFRLWAELDERNFATFYEYDEEGKLLRIKKETERGVYTIQESKQGTSKNF